MLALVAADPGDEAGKALDAVQKRYDSVRDLRGSFEQVSFSVALGAETISKGTVAGCALSLIPLLAGWTATPAHVVATLQVLVGVEEIAIAILVPWHVGEMPTVFHAWRLREKKASANTLEAAS